MRYEKYRKVLLDCRPEGIGFANEAVLYFCEFFDRFAGFFTVYPEVVLILRGEGQDQVRIPVKHKEDIAREKEFCSDDEVMGRKEGEVMIIPYTPSDDYTKQLRKTVSSPLLVSGRCSAAVEDVRANGCGLYYNDFYEFEGGLSYLLGKDSIFK
ncbi:MAG: hypothetical protein J5685_04330 [Clostridiales bacterium]|nr:hypothetical protein [Clostridiales bacterium]